MASNCLVISASRVVTSAKRRASASPGAPPAGATPPIRVSQNLQIRLTKLPSTSARSRFTAETNCSHVKVLSECSGALAVRYQRQQSAGSISKAVSMNTPWPRDVENFPPCQWR
jgi:hypothetical protein